jgi:radical SAM superfamily enzyme YgiQ (UPF0313 family)
MLLKNMEILIVTPGHPGPDKRSLPPALTAPYLAAIASPFAKTVSICDLAVERFALKGPLPDVALFTSTMAQFDHVFELATYLKGQGVTIFFGGPHATLAYDFDPRIREVSDCVVLGEGEEALPRALRDLAAGRLQPTYSVPVESLAGVPFSRLDLLDHRRYYSTTVMIGTRGCVNRCTYCSIADLYGHKYLKRPVDEVIEEIKYQTSRPNLGWLDRKLITFWDDNPGCDLEWFNELLEKMIPLKKWWLSQMCLNIAESEETVKLMKASGCKGIFAGIESVKEETLRDQNKEAVNSVRDYKRQAGVLLKHGVNIIGAVMFGFDTDTEESLLEDTLAVVEEMGLTLLQCHLVTPYPHSDYFKQLDRENRLVTKECKYYNGFTVVHQPKNIAPARLQEIFFETRKRFYSWRSVLKRMSKHNLHKYPDFLIWNALYYKPNYQVIPGVDAQKWGSHLDY